MKELTREEWYNGLAKPTINILTNNIKKTKKAIPHKEIYRSAHFTDLFDENRRYPLLSGPIL